jgi:hypothetical protein
MEHCFSFRGVRTQPDSTNHSPKEYLNPFTAHPTPATKLKTTKVHVPFVWERQKYERHGIVLEQ